MVRVTRNYLFRGLLLASVYSLGILGIVASGSGGGGSSNLIICGPDEVANQNFSAQAPIAIGINVVNHNELLLNGKQGNVSVSGLPGATSITVTGMKRVLSESVQDAQAHLQDLTVTAQDLTTSALLKTNQPQCDLGRGYIVDYTITLPDFFLVRINNNGGEVSIDSIDNEVSINNVAGTVTLTDIVGSAAINLVSGNIVAEIISLPLNGTIQMKILTGDINLEIPTITSADFTARVFTGNITLTNLMLQSPVVTPNLVTGTLGTGQGNIDLETEVIGDIDVLGI
jgi:hypothetical protein